MDTMTLTKKDGTTEEVEIVMTFKIEKYNNNDYVIYKSQEKYYAARFIEKEGNTELITELSDEEKAGVTKIFKKLHEGGII